MLTRYGLERSTARVGRSGHRDRFVPNGAMLFALWREEPHRATRDVDFPGYGYASEATLRAAFEKFLPSPGMPTGLLHTS